MAADPIRSAGDPDARVAGARIAELFERHSRMVYGLCRARLRDPDEADDATQATFVSAYAALLGGGKVRDPAAWIATIARNECTTRASARMREPLSLVDTDLVHGAGPEAELDRKAVVEELQQAIAELPDKQREAVVLRDLYGLHYNEVGAALGISVASVESLLFRARRTLRVSLKPLAGGSLVVPIAVREGVAQALPGFTTAGAAGGGAAAGVVGLGLLAKLSGGPLAMKVVAGVAAVTAAGSAAVVGIEHADRGLSHEAAPRSHVRSRPADSGAARMLAGAAVLAPTDNGQGGEARGRVGNDVAGGQGETAGGRQHGGSSGAPGGGSENGGMSGDGGAVESSAVEIGAVESGAAGPGSDDHGDDAASGVRAAHHDDDDAPDTADNPRRADGPGRTDSPGRADSPGSADGSSGRHEASGGNDSSERSVDSHEDDVTTAGEDDSDEPSGEESGSVPAPGSDSSGGGNASDDHAPSDESASSGESDLPDESGSSGDSGSDGDPDPNGDSGSSDESEHGPSDGSTASPPPA